MSKSATLDNDTRTAAASPSVAALPMYDLPQLKPATDAFWDAIAERLKNAGLTSVPASLTRTDDYQGVWRNPDLLLGQACGYPLITQLEGVVQIVATPIYGSPGCEGIEHSSFFVVNAKAEHRTLRDLRGSVCAINGFDSNTGMNLLRAAIAPLAEDSRFFRSVVVTGAHYKSLEAVADGRADVAAIDCVSFAHFQHFEPDLTARVSKIGQSASTAAPPYITARNTDVAILRILREALRDVATAHELESVRSALNIEGFAFETDAVYERLLLIKDDAAALGYPELR
jgi:ABC-type phosphate/phosphonate transport system substrate-binding protein